jgi:outer membrane protein
VASPIARTTPHFTEGTIPDMRIASTIVLSAVCASLTTAFALPLISGAPATAPAAAAEGEIALCDTTAIMQELLESDRYAPALEEKRQELEDRITQLQEELTEQVAELEERYIEAQEADDQAAKQSIGQEYQQIQQRLQQLQQEASTEINEFRSQQLKDAFTEIAESARGVGEEMGFAYVASSTPPDKEFENAAQGGLALDVISRLYLHYPEGTDITADVRDDLNL